jgi:hypothetical protein
LLRQAN